MSERVNGKTEWGLCVVRENVERGAESGMMRENVELRKLAIITGPIQCEGAESMSKLVWY